MGVHHRGKKWVARLKVNGSTFTVGVCGSENAARVCLAQHEEAVRAGTSPYVVPGGRSLRSFAQSIGVRYGTVRRWSHEGMPVVRNGDVVLVVPGEASRWIEANRSDGVGFERRSVVYFAEREGDGAIKIGWSSDISRRLREVRKDTRGEVDLLAAIPGDKPLELRLQARFADDHLEREWFRPSERLKTFIAAIGRTVAV